MQKTLAKFRLLKQEKLFAYPWILMLFLVFYISCHL